MPETALGDVSSDSKKNNSIRSHVTCKYTWLRRYMGGAQIKMENNELKKTNRGEEGEEAPTSTGYQQAGKGGA